jgi:hypothetical protein
MAWEIEPPVNKIVCRFKLYFENKSIRLYFSIRMENAKDSFYAPDVQHEYLISLKVLSWRGARGCVGLFD